MVVDYDRNATIVAFAKPLFNYLQICRWTFDFELRTGL